MAPRAANDRTALAERAVGALGVLAPPPIHVQTPVFEGSLATLFACVRDHKVDLLGVPLFPICEAYFAYLLASDMSQLDEAAAALSALSYLLERKAWLLLPVEEPEPEFEEPAELPDPTISHYQTVMDTLRLWQAERDLVHFRSPDAGPDVYELPYSLSDVSAEDLAAAFRRVLLRANPEPMAPLARPKRSLAEHMKTVLLAVSFEWRGLGTLMTGPITKEEVVWWFLGLLELIRLGHVDVRATEDDVEFRRT